MPSAYLFTVIWIICLCAQSQTLTRNECKGEADDTIGFLQTSLSHSIRGKIAPSKSRRRSGPTSKDDRYDLNDGTKMPVIGLGTYKMEPGNETYASVLAALKMGYRMIDTAEYYENEADIGRAVRDSGIPRSEVYITTKIWDEHHTYDKAIDAGKKSNETLGLGYIDLILMHTPGVFVKPGNIVETWDAIVYLRDIGVTTSVGVSNFGVVHLEALKEYCRPTPVLNQFELFPYSYEHQKDIVDYCEQEHILVEAYGSLLAGHDEYLDLADSIAASYNKTEAQVMLRWALDKGYAIIPKSTHLNYLAENLDIFDFHLSDADITALEDLSGPDHLLIDYLTIPDDVSVGDTSHGTGCQ